MKAIGKILLLLVWHTSFSQWTDDFSDGEFLSFPPWQGKISSFIVENQSLRLNAAAVAGTSYLSTSSDIINDAIWEFKVRLQFNPSSSNYADIYLVADTANLDDPVNGYFIRVGTSADNISLVRQTGLTETIIIAGIAGRVSLSDVDLAIMVSRSVSGEWQLSSKLLGEVDWSTEGVTTDITYSKSSFFGLKCTYTATRSDKFYFDDFRVSGEPYKDIIPPKLDTVYATAENQLLINYDEELGSAARSSFQLNGLNPSKVVVRGNSVELEFQKKFQVINTVAISAVQDLIGNEGQDTTLTMIYFADEPVQVGDIVINEMMVDPSPPEDLPDVEYLEIRNSSNKAINMTNWSLSDRSTSGALPFYGLLPDSTLVLVEKKELDQLLINNKIGISPWPSLNNGGDSLTLISQTGEIIDQVVYSTEWYQHTDRNGGGFSLERIDPYHPCSNIANWSASQDIKGGTPGDENSVFKITEDDTAPEILETKIENQNHINIIFTEQLDSLPKAIFLQDHTIQGFEFTNELHQTISIVTTTLAPSIPIWLSVKNFYDCFENLNQADSSLIILPEKAEQGDIVISEILFNPFLGSEDFIEIINPSAKYISLEDWQISNGSSSKRIEIKNLIAPNEVLVFSVDPESLIEDYPLSNAENIVDHPLPTFPNKSGAVVLYNSSSNLVDSILYNEDWHFSYLENIEGISLERISLVRSAITAANWASGANQYDYATPGYRRMSYEEGEYKNELVVNPKVLVPDANGVDDYTLITLKLKSANALSTVEVYNLNGQLVTILAANQLAMADLSLKWDGTDNRGAIVPLGHYIIVVNVIYDSGESITYREKVVVGNGF